MDLSLGILKLLHPSSGSSTKWLCSKLSLEKEKLVQTLTMLMKQGLISNGSCDDSACSKCSGGCESMVRNDIDMYTITPKGQDYLKGKD